MIPQVSLICIQATKGYGIYSDIAVDNVVLIGGCCQAPTTTTPPPPPTQTTTIPRPPKPCDDLDYCIDCICHEENYIREANGVTYVDTCGISRSYFYQCKQTGALTIANPTYLACMTDSNCKRECIKAFVTKHLLDCVGTSHLAYVSCMDVVRAHSGKAMCRRKEAFDFGYKIMHKYYSKYNCAHFESSIISQ